MGALTSAAVERSHNGHTGAANHVASIRGRWAAAACLAVLTARIEEQLRFTNSLQVNQLDTMSLANGSFCHAEVFDPGAMINDSMQGLLARLDSVLNEHHATDARARLVTRHGDGRINIAAASAMVLLALPGMTDEAVRAIEDARQWDKMPADIHGLLFLLPPVARASLAEEYQSLIGLTAFGTTSLVVRSLGWINGFPSSIVEVVIVNGGKRAAIVYQRVS
jgi:hypothetical protein